MARLISLNIERSRHLDRFIPFLRDMAPDVVCLQELAASDLPGIMAEAGLPHSHYIPMAVHPGDGKTFGVGLLARHAFTRTDVVTYAGRGDGTLHFDRTSPESRVETCRYVIALASLDVGGLALTVGTTHFPWTPDGQSRPFQTTALDSLMAQLGSAPIVLTGDFNAPRGGPIFDRMAAHWRDCIPPEVTTSVDPKLHRAGPLELMVDGLFVSPHYVVSDVRMHTGVSDHQAVSATIEG